MREAGASPRSLPFEWAVASRPRHAGQVSGDRHVVVPLATGALVAVADGLGHGPEAAEAAEAAIRVLCEHTGEQLASLVHRCHDALIGTRGAALTLALAAAEAGDPGHPGTRAAGTGTLTWGGIGNVEGRLVRPAVPDRAEGPLLLGGVVGYRIPPLRTTVAPLAPGDVFILSTDGVTPHYVEGLALGDGVQAMADRILEIHGRDDDALVLVARWSGMAESGGGAPLANP